MTYRIPKIKPVDGPDDRWILLENWPVKHGDWRYTISSGYIYDLASIPKWARSIIQKTDRRTWGPALEHDYRCENKIKTSSATHREFYNALRENGMNWWRANAAYIAVLIGGPRF